MVPVQVQRVSHTGINEGSYALSDVTWVPLTAYLIADNVHITGSTATVK